MRLSRTTWATLAVFGGLVLFYLMVLSAAQVYYVPVSPPMSTFNTTDEGLAAFYRYLTAAGAQPQRLMQYETLPDPGTAVLVLAGPPLRRPTTGRIRQLKDWVTQGGRLLIVAEEVNRFHDIVGVRLLGGRVPLQEEIEHVQATRLTVGVERVRMRAGKSLTDLPDGSVVHIGPDDRPRVVSMTVGRGTVVVVGDEWAMSNAGLKAADNLQLALDLATSKSGGPIVFDEFHHGYAAGGGALARLGTGARLSLVQLCVAALVLLLAARRRLGTPQEAVETARRSPVEYVQSLAALLRRAKAAPRVAAMLGKGFERDVAVRLGRAVKDERTMARLLEDRGWHGAARAMSRIRERVTDDDALVEYAKTMAEGRREVSGAHTGRGRSR